VYKHKFVLKIILGFWKLSYFLHLVNENLFLQDKKWCFLDTPKDFKYLFN